MLDCLDLNKYNDALSRGLRKGEGSQDGQMCIEAAICYALGLPHGDDPKCVSKAVRSFKINLNDSDWSSTKARADGLRDLGLAQLGSLGVIDDAVFTQQLALRTVNKLIPALFREVFPNNEEMLEIASKCELAVDLQEAADAAANVSRYAAYSAAATDAAANVSAAAAHAAHAAAARAAEAADDANAAANAAAYYAAEAAAAANAHANAYDDAAANAADAADAADAAARAARAALATNASDEPDKYLKMSANMALDILKKLGSPGCKFLS